MQNTQHPQNTQNTYYDSLEHRPAAEREAALFAALGPHLAKIQQQNPAYANLFAQSKAANISNRAALATLPVLRKQELLERQKQSRNSTAAQNNTNNAHDPFGGYARHLRGPQIRRIFASPGPIYEPESPRSDYWGAARALYAAGFRSGDLVHNAFSYHMTPGAFILESGAHALGCTVFPAGTGQTEQQLEAMQDLQPNGYVGTPSFLRILLEKASANANPLPFLRKALLSGEAFPPSLRDWLAERGVAGYQCYATADLGVIAYETSAREGLVVNENLIVEIVRPGTGDPLPDGEVGELVVTNLNPDYPLIRFGTGDLSAILPGPCPSGRSNTRIKGWMGRADQTTKIRGMFVHPGQISEILKRHPEIGKVRLTVEGEMAQDSMTLHAEYKNDAAANPSELAANIATTVRESTKLRAEIRLCAPGSLPNDGKIIEDARSYA